MTDVNRDRTKIIPTRTPLQMIGMVFRAIVHTFRNATRKVDGKFGAL